MTEILFYQLQGQKLESVLLALLEKSLERGWKVVVQGSTEERIEALDAHLWTYRDDGFLPHGTWRESEAAQQPVLLTLNDRSPLMSNGISGLCWCSMAKTMKQWPRHVRTGPKSGRKVSRQPTGKRTNKGAGRKRAEGREQPRGSGRRIGRSMHHQPMADHSVTLWTTRACSAPL